MKIKPVSTHKMSKEVSSLSIARNAIQFIQLARVLRSRMTTFLCGNYAVHTHLSVSVFALNKQNCASVVMVSILCCARCHYLFVSGGHT